MFLVYSTDGYNNNNNDADDASVSIDVMDVSDFDGDIEALPTLDDPPVASSPRPPSTPRGGQLQRSLPLVHDVGRCKYY